jgi:hypothetical protein
MTDNERGFRDGLTDANMTERDAFGMHAGAVEYRIAYRAGRRAVFIQTVQGMATKHGMPSGAALFADGTFASCNG